MAMARSSVQKHHHHTHREQVTTSTKTTPTTPYPNSSLDLKKPGRVKEVKFATISKEEEREGREVEMALFGMAWLLKMRSDIRYNGPNGPGPHVVLSNYDLNSTVAFVYKDIYSADILIDGINL